MRRTPALLLIALVAAFALQPAVAADLLNYPPSERGDVVDDYHGTKVADPYRWLEEDARNSFKVRSWVEEQNALTFRYLETIPERAAIRGRLTTLWNYEKFSAPEKVGDLYYLVAPMVGTSEGGLGSDSTGTARAEPGTACAPREATVTNCP